MNAPDDEIPGIVFRDPDEAFAQALAQGRLVLDPASPLYCGLFMYMGTQASDGKDLFKHIWTRKYLP